MRVAVMIDNLGPYHVARLTAAARVMDVLAVQVRPSSRVYQWTSTELATPASAALAHVTLVGADAPERPSWRTLATALDSTLRPFQPDAIALPGWSSAASLAGLDWAAANGIATILMSDSNRHDFGRLGAAERIKTSIARAFSAGLAAGAAAQDYLIALGLPADSVFLGYDVVDNAYFAASAARVKATTAMPVIGAGAVLDPSWRGCYFLASARFVAAKNLAGLVRAYAEYRKTAPAGHVAWPLVVLGDGPLRGDLEALRGQLGLEGCVHFPGFKQYVDLPGYYGSAGAFVHASTMEPWGLVVNEAMASGLPVAVSSRCGCAATLVADGDNGVTFDPADAAAMTAALMTLATHPDLSALGEASRRRIVDWGPERFASGLLQACERACGTQTRPMSYGMRAVVRMTGEIQALRS